MADPARAGEAVGGVDHLARHGGVGELGRIGPHHQRQRPVAGLVIAGGQIERPRQLHPVGASIADQLFGDTRQLRRRVGEAGQGVALRRVQVAHEQVRGIIPGFAPGHQPASVFVEDADDALIVAGRRGPKPLGLAVRQVHRRKERIFALAGGPRAAHQNPAVGGEADDGESIVVGLGHGRAGIVVAVLVVPLQQHSPGPGVGRIDHIAGLVPGVEPAAAHQGRIRIPPSHAGVALLEVHQGRRSAAERRCQQEDPVPHLGRGARVAAVLGFGPDEGCGRIGAPLHGAGAGRHRVKWGRDVVPQRQIGDPVHDPTLQIGHDDVGGKQAGRHDIAVRPLGCGLQDMAPVGRHARAQIDRWRAQRPRRPGQRNEHQLRGEIVVEQGLITGIGQQVLIGP